MTEARLCYDSYVHYAVYSLAADRSIVIQNVRNEIYYAEM